MPGQAPELRITPHNDSLSITCGRKRYLLPAEVVLAPTTGSSPPQVLL
ncbi:MAG: hypothetical protein ACRDQY_08505 [Pseudonocardiaceae bacterium]